ncbi:MAG TPA: ABC transporter ATP-binding protein [Saprospiraceae bacterium]|nr:ABC transporter ATP-binding protein [Saprospiraceae bacterium]HPI06809.1 ABC transporter ATP-binding protein [Saprospiraceae bacterium]
MIVRLQNAGKRYRLDWIFRGLEYTFDSPGRYAVLGPNGSGKSTLLKVLSGHLSPSKGRILFEKNGKTLEPDDVYHSVSYAAPYIELIEEFTLEEALKFHARLKPMLPGITPVRLYELLSLPRARAKEIRFFSSGMKQRVKLALAICCDTPILLLDEPATNLDVQGVQWYKNLIAEFAADRLVIIASNDPHDAEFCPVHLNILDFK